MDGYYPETGDLTRAMKNRKKFIFLLINLFFIFYSIESQAVSSINGQNLLINNLDPLAKNLHDFNKQTQQKNGILQLRHNSLNSVFKTHLASFFRNPYIHFRKNNSADYYSIKGNLYAGDLPICGVEIGATQGISGVRIFTGSVPFIRPDATPVLRSSWPHFEDILFNISQSEQIIKLSGLKKIISYHMCHAIVDSDITPAYEIIFSSEKSGVYRATVDEHNIFTLNPLKFHLSRLAKSIAYNGNPNEGESEQDIIVDESGFLKNNLFSTITHEIESVTSVAEERDNQQIHIFRSDTNNPMQKNEINAFTNAWRAYNIFKENVGEHLENHIELELNVTINNSLNNAIYQPISPNGKPRISVSNGDGFILKNLALDADVIFHEYGHHILWEHIKNTSGEALVLHEGIADFLAFSATGDSCLGESICPTGSTFCWYRNQCLRSADNSIQYLDPTYSVIDPHLKGQVISGLLWDLYKQYNIALENVTKMTFEAISMLTSSSNIIDFILALKMADNNLNNGRNLCALREAIESRGFGAYINMNNCTKVGSPWTKIHDTDFDENKNSQPKKDKSFLGGCYIGDRNDSNNSPYLILILLTSPFLLISIGSVLRISQKISKP